MGILFSIRCLGLCQHALQFFLNGLVAPVVASAALAATFVPSRATTPSFTRPASWHNLTTSTKSSSSASSCSSPKATDGTDVWLPVGRHHPESYIFLCTPAITSVGCIELPHIHLPYCIHNEPGQVTLAQPIPHGRRHQVALVSLAAQKVISHSIVPACCFYELTPSPTPRKEGLWTRFNVE